MTDAASEDPKAPQLASAPAPASAPPAGAQTTGLTIQRPVIVGILFLANFMLTFSVIVGVVLAYVWRAETDTPEWERTHYTYFIRTFWVGLVLGIVGVIVWFGAFFATIPFEPGQGSPPDAIFFVVVIGMILGWLLLAAWFCTRCILSLIKSSKREHMPRPKSWLF